ncbi:MAG: TonB-dependent receptor [Bacteroidota bacterium]
MRTVLLSLFSLFIASSLCAQNADLWGIVVDNESQEPMAGVSVYFPTLLETLVTNEKGEFRIDKVATGRHVVVVEVDGYQPYEDDFTLDERGISLNIFLDPGVAITDEVIITAIRASEQTATAFTNLNKEEIREQNYGQDIPILLDQTPSVVVNSDAGAGIGYTGLRIRGSDQTRINVTLNGIPLNDPEGHGVFWVNMPDFASSTNQIQVQRGVGTSTNGTAAFGGSVNIQTTTLNYEPYAEVALSRGSFNTAKNTLNVGTGLINNRFAFDARLSNITSDGWVDRASSDLNSFFLTGGYYGEKSMFKVNVFSGRERTYQSWFGVPESFLDDPALRRSNYYTYENEVDNYQQNHYQAFYAFEANDRFNFNVGLHYTKGFGYFEQYREGEDLGDYGFTPLQLVQGPDTISTTDLIRRRWLDNDFVGMIYSMNYKPMANLSFTLGGASNQYIGDHFGEIIWAQYAGETDIRERYYDNTSRKGDNNAYFKTLYQAGKRFTAFVDLQLRAIDYVYGDSTFTGPGIDNDQRPLQGDFTFVFFNPKAGVTFQLDPKSQLYTSFAISNREPVRTDFIDAPEGRIPQHETLRDWELGYRFKTKGFRFNANYYFMDYTNQLVLNGELNDVGSALRQNVEDSYRTGIELIADARLTPWMSLAANATLSRNRIAAFEEFVYDYDNGGIILNQYEDTDIAFSPNAIAGMTLNFTPVKGLNIDWVHKYVGRQYLDNTSQVSRSLDPFYVSQLRTHYDWTPQWAKQIRFGVQINNLFNAQYEPNGYTFSYIAGGGQVTENFYYPQAGRNFLASLTVKL